MLHRDFANEYVLKIKNMVFNIIVMNFQETSNKIYFHNIENIIASILSLLKRVYSEKEIQAENRKMTLEIISLYMKTSYRSDDKLFGINYLISMLENIKHDRLSETEANSINKWLKEQNILDYIFTFKEEIFTNRKIAKF